jgi:DNA-binding NarL/FixJ family response regulator
LRDKINRKSPPRRFFPILEEVLTAREADVVRAISNGRMNREIAEELGISPQTVRHHLKSVFGKLHVSSRLELALLAARDRL